MTYLRVVLGLRGGRGLFFLLSSGTAEEREREVQSGSVLYTLIVETAKRIAFDNVIFVISHI